MRSTVAIDDPRIGSHGVNWPVEAKENAFNHVVNEVSAGRSVKDILDNDANMPTASSFWNWLNSNDIWSEKLTRARELGVEAHLDEALSIADNSNEDLIVVHSQKEGKDVVRVRGEAIARSRLRVETRFKRAALIAPRKYGDKLDVTSGGQPIALQNSTVIDARVQSIMLLADQRRRAAEMLED